jgi:hypothetical protein
MLLVIYRIDLIEQEERQEKPMEHLVEEHIKEHRQI